MPNTHSLVSFVSLARTRSSRSSIIFIVSHLGFGPPPPCLFFTALGPTSISTPVVQSASLAVLIRLAEIVSMVLWFCVELVVANVQLIGFQFCEVLLEKEVDDDEEKEEVVIGYWSAFVWLAGLTALISLLSELVVDAIEGEEIETLGGKMRGKDRDRGGEMESIDGVQGIGLFEDGDDRRVISPPKIVMGLGLNPTIILPQLLVPNQTNPNTSASQCSHRLSPSLTASLRLTVVSHRLAFHGHAPRLTATHGVPPSASHSLCLTHGSGVSAQQSRTSASVRLSRLQRLCIDSRTSASVASTPVAIDRPPTTPIN
ncbi:hypothetical protein Syun_014164 [Stephania yunnanensis]|uniref:Uncharacterized protein n=1 Tax=Stephania yunnanensis TaxID=152371 RepID=A0AAP0JJ16_9MAGN